MAVLALGLAGAALAPAGYAAIGWTAGTILGQLLFSEKQQSINEGPRLADLRVQASSYGVGIPIVAGTVKLAGNLLWTSGIRESVTETTEEVGKGGGAEVTNRTYSYFASFQIGLCKGPITGVRRIWAEGELIYDANANNVDQIAAAGALGGQITVYPGDEAQNADPTMEAWLGAGNVPAHRGLAYIVFADYDVTRWGRIPNLELEIVASGTTAVPIAVDSPPSTQTAFSGNQGYHEGGLVYLAKCTAGGVPATKVELYTVTPSGALLSYTVQENNVFSHSGSGTYVPPSNIRGLFVPAGQSGSWWRWMRLQGSTEIVSDLTIPGSTLLAGNTIHGVYRIGDVVLLSGAYGTQRYLNFYRWNDAQQLPQITPFRTHLVACATANEATRVSLAVDGQSFYVNRQFAGTSQRGVDQYDLDGNLVDSWDWDSVTSNAANQAGFVVIDGLAFVSASSGSNGILARLQPGGAYIAVNTSHAVNTGVLSGTNGFTLPIPGGIAWGWDTGSALLTPSITPGTATLGPLVEDLCELAGLAAGEVDRTALTDTVRGYVVGRPMTARAAIEPLAKAFAFDAVESDQKLKFVKRGGASAVTVPADDLGAAEPGAEPGPLVAVSRLDETEAPREVRVGYWNADGAYRQGSEAARRLVVRSVEQLFEDLPLVLSPDEAARIANRLLYTAHLERMPLTWATGAEYDRYEPTDVVTLQAGSTTYVARITRKTNDGQRITWEGVLEDAGAHAGAGSGATDQEDATALAVPGPSLLELMDIPILRDADDDPGFYAAMGGVLTTWRGGVLMGSADDINFTQASGVSNSAAVGQATTALGNFSGGNVFDELSRVTVRLASGTLESLTEAEVLAGGNAALLGTEVILFRTATFVSGTTWTLSGLLRGRIGTEAGMSTHVIGDRFILLKQGGGIMRVPLATADLNRTRYYKAVSYGLPPAGAASQAFTNTGAGIKPLSPAYLRGFRNAALDITITWVRRTRVGGEWRDYVDASLGEASESYEVDVMDGTVVKRTISSTSPTVTYTSAQQITDWGINKPSLQVRVYQLSATAGRGTPATGSV